MSHPAAVIRRELLWMIIALAVGILLLPPLIWLAGSRVLGAYGAGGAGELLHHFFGGLAAGSPGFWIVALGPYAFLLLLRLLLRTLQAVRAAA